MKPKIGKYYLFKTKTTYSSYPKIAYGKCIQLSKYTNWVLFEVWFGGWHDMEIGTGRYWHSKVEDIIKEIKDYEIPIYILEETE
jgi:hypothetical protein